MLALPVIVGHKKPLFSFWSKFKELSYSDNSDSCICLDPIDFLGKSDQELGEYFYLFGLRKYLQNSSHEYQILIVAHYRRFLSSSAIGTRSNLAYVRTLTSGEAEATRPEIILPISGTRLIAGAIPLGQGGVLTQFAQHHPVEEFYKFLAASVDEGVISAEDAANIPLASALIPAPSIGVFQLNEFIQDMTTLEGCTRAYLRHKQKEFSGYQRRIIAFCLERIHSHLTLKKVAKYNLGNSSLGYQILISEDGVARPSGRDRASE